MIVLDSSGIIALLRSTERNHLRAVAAVQSDRGPLVVPAGILSEVTYMLERRVGSRGPDAFVESILSGTVLLDCGEQDFPRIRHLMQRYLDMPIGFADAAVIACAERRGGKVLTYDQRHFPVVAREGTIQIVGGA